MWHDERGIAKPLTEEKYRNAAHRCKTGGAVAIDTFMIYVCRIVPALPCAEDGISTKGAPSLVAAKSIHVAHTPLGIAKDRSGRLRSFLVVGE